MSKQAQTVPGFEVTTFTHQSRTYRVYRAGAGPAVVVLHEIPGLHPGVIEFGRRLVDAGSTAYMPSLFGRPGARTPRERPSARWRRCAWPASSPSWPTAPAR